MPHRFLCGHVPATLRFTPPLCYSLRKLDLKRGTTLPYALYHATVNISRSSYGLIQAAESAGSPRKPAQAHKIFESDRHESSSATDKKSSKESIMGQLKRYGLAGMLSYGLLNTAYYLGMFLFAWFYISPVSGGLGFRAAAERFIKVFALVWAGSQVTKIPRAACALAVAPPVDRTLTWLTEHSRFKSRREVFGVVVLSCFGIALIVFLVITLLWA